MPVETIYTLTESNITVSGGGQLSGLTQGDGSHLDGLTITLNNNNWQAVEIFDDDSNFADNDGSQQLEGAQTYDGVSYADNLRVEAEFSLTLQDPDGNIYVAYAFNINEPGVTSYATVEGLAFQGGVGEFPPIGVPLTVIASGEGPTNPYLNLASPPCFMRGTHIETVQGTSAIEDLSVDDLVITLSGEPKPIRCILSTKLPSVALRANPKLVPICVTAGALGHGLPVRDLHVSRQHRFLVSSRVAERMFNATQVLVSANKLTALPGIYAQGDATEVEYFHILFDAHEVIFAEGAPTESLYTGPEALKSVPTDVREEILTLFPELIDMDYSSDPALPIVSGSQLNTLIARHLKNRKPLLETYET